MPAFSKTQHFKFQQLYNKISQMSHIWWLVVLTVILNLSDSQSKLIQEPCKPFGVRLNLGLKFNNETETQMLGIRFNTRGSCPNSYVMLQKPFSFITKLPCAPDSFTLGEYTGYVHKCSVSNLQYGDEFSYMVYGWQGQGSGAPIPYQNGLIKSHIMNNRNEVKIVVLADWGYLRVKAGVYDPLDSAFKTMIDMGDKIDGIYIGGDIAYDLDSYQGLYYEDFITMLSQVGSRWPVILNTGNHEHLTVEDEVILQKSFEIYGSLKSRLTVIHLPFVNWFMLDPYKIVFKSEDPTVLVNQFEDKLKLLKSKQSSKPVIACSHYPYRCNGNIPDCYDVRQKLTPFFNKMMQYNVALYIGAHYHTYERIYPFRQNGEFEKKESPYTWVEGGASDYHENTLLSIVQGIAGNDREIIQVYPPAEDFTAAKVINNTGFGIMTIRSESLTYDHVIYKNPYNSLDHWQILFSKKVEKLNIRKEDD